MDSKEKIAIFDFCETLIKFQTADAFIDYVYERTKSTRMRYINLLRKILIKLKIPKLFKILWEKKSINKRMRLYMLKGYHKVFLEKMAEDFYVEKLKTNIIKETEQELIRLRSKGYTIGVVSGALDIYLDRFVKENKIDFYICSKMAYKNGKFTGWFEGKDCMGKQKVIELRKVFKAPIEHSFVFSDSYSDLPLLQWAKNGVVVSKSKHQDWIDNFNFNEIIW